MAPSSSRTRYDPGLASMPPPRSIRCRWLPGVYYETICGKPTGSACSAPVRGRRSSTESTADEQRRDLRSMFAIQPPLRRVHDPQRPGRVHRDAGWERPDPRRRRSPDPQLGSVHHEQRDRGLRARHRHRPGCRDLHQHDLRGASRRSSATTIVNNTARSTVRRPVRGRGGGIFITVQGDVRVGHREHHRLERLGCRWRDSTTRISAPRH